MCTVMPLTPAIMRARISRGSVALPEGGRFVGSMDIETSVARMERMRNPGKPSQPMGFSRITAPRLRRQSPHHEPVEPRRKRGGIGRHFAIEDLRLVEQDRGEIIDVVVARRG